ncbi:unnamed protein product, partial [marine sediment metagenome]
TLLTHDVYDQRLSRRESNCGNATEYTDKDKHGRYRQRPHKEENTGHQDDQAAHKGDQDQQSPAVKPIDNHSRERPK